MLDCNRLRTSVILAGGLFLLGLLLLVLAEVTPFAMLTSQLALLAILAGSGLLAVAFLASLLPVSAKRLSNCQH
jgi:hypothetical protein